MTDHLNSVLNSEMAGPTHRYELFGGANGAAPLSMTSDPVSFGYAGGIHNRESKTTKFGLRDLHPDTGRWGQMDPLGYKSMDENLYRYVFNKPFLLVDPSGLKIFNHAGNKIPPSIINSPLWKLIDSLPGTVIIAPSKLPKNVFGQTASFRTHYPHTRLDIVDVDFSKHTCEADLKKTFADEFSHVLGNAIPLIRTSEDFDHDYITPILEEFIK